MADSWTWIFGDIAWIRLFAKYVCELVRTNPNYETEHPTTNCSQELNLDIILKGTTE